MTPASLAGAERYARLHAAARDGSCAEESSATVRCYRCHYVRFYRCSGDCLAEMKAQGRKWLAKMALCEPSVLGATWLPGPLLCCAAVPRATMSCR